MKVRALKPKRVTGNRVLLLFQIVILMVKRKRITPDGIEA
jgi:hypothetical protein